jgi:hypothetical protein
MVQIGLQVEISWKTSWKTLLTGKHCLGLEFELLLYQLPPNVPQVVETYDLKSGGILQRDYNTTAQTSKKSKNNYS